MLFGVKKIRQARGLDLFIERRLGGAT